MLAREAIRRNKRTRDLDVAIAIVNKTDEVLNDMSK